MNDVNELVLRDLQSVAPLVILIGTGIFALLLDLGGADAARRRALVAPLCFLGLIAAIAAAMNAALPAMQMVHKLLPADTKPPAYFGDSIVEDPFAALLQIALCVVAMLSIGMAGDYLRARRLPVGEFHALILFATSGAMLMVQAVDLINVFVGLEVLSVSLYILAGYTRRDLRSEESAVKYFLLGAFASGFLLYGIALLYGAIGLSVTRFGMGEDSVRSFTNIYVMGEAIRNSQLTDHPTAASPLFIAGIALIIVGLGFKASIVPFHSYAPDVYEGAPAPVSAFMSAAAKIGALAALVRILQPLTIVADQAATIVNILWGLAAATMLVGNILAVRQRAVKRMLAYSSIAHAGYLLSGVVATCLPGGSGLASDAIVFYLFAYAFMNVGSFAVVVWLGRDGGERLQIAEFSGLGRRDPVAGVVLTVLLLSLAGIPLTAGFLAKVYLFLGVIQSQLVGLAALGLIASVIGIFYYFRLAVAIWFGEPAFDDSAPVQGGGAKTVAIVCAVATLVFGVVPAGMVSPDTTPTFAEVAPEKNPFLQDRVDARRKVLQERERAGGSGRPEPALLGTPQAH